MPSTLEEGPATRCILREEEEPTHVKEMMTWQLSQRFRSEHDRFRLLWDDIALLTDCACRFIFSEMDRRMS